LGFSHRFKKTKSLCKKKVRESHIHPHADIGCGMHAQIPHGFEFRRVGDLDYFYLSGKTLTIVLSKLQKRERIKKVLASLVEASISGTLQFLAGVENKYLLIL
jgi:hypothetical protein